MVLVELSLLVIVEKWMNNGVCLLILERKVVFVYFVILFVILKYLCVFVFLV